ncbi:ATP-binding cassette domain-containing protein [Streptomyces sp. NPDC056568]|uniref:ABC transporter ATP-binding protein n=1 Tax=Streptomyces sp. NPDC056568 TaxID=3345866 RepID=UPI0036C2D09B
MTGVPVLAADGAAVTLGDTTLLAPTTFEISPGELWCVTGSNGTGKTTLLRAFVGSRGLTSGSVSVRGERADMARPAHRRFLASLVEPIPVARDMTLREQVTLVAASWYGNGPETAERAERVVERLGLASLGERFPHQVSSGQSQLFSLALTLVRPADVVLLDEPERHLDRHRVELVATLLAERADGTAASALWTAGAVCVYLGSGWIGETWRGLRDELTLPPLLGEWWGGAVARALTWPVLAVAAGTCLGAGMAVLVGRPLYDGRPGETAVLVAGTLVLVLGARFLREMKTHLPLSLLLPIVTPFGDLSALMIVAWQFDGFVALVAGVAVMNAVPSVSGAAVLAVSLAACCVWAGLRRTGWAHRGLLHRFRRA